MAKELEFLTLNTLFDIIHAKNYTKVNGCVV